MLNNYRIFYKIIIDYKKYIKKTFLINLQLLQIVKLNQFIYVFIDVIYQLILLARIFSLLLNTSIDFPITNKGGSTPVPSTVKINFSFFLLILIRLVCLAKSQVLVHSSQKIQSWGRATSTLSSFSSYTFFGQDYTIAFLTSSGTFCILAKSTFTSGSGWKVAMATGHHLECILPIPF